MKRFKLLETPEERVQYALDHLPRLGRGAARIVFGLGSGKILKIVHSKRGNTQTRNEVEAYTKSGAEDFLAKIYDFDSENYMWLIAEGVKIIADNADLMSKMHVSEVALEWVIMLAYQNIEFDEALVQGIEYHNNHYKDEFTKFTINKPIELSDLNNLDLELFEKAFEATKAGIEDIERYDHWGMTTDGRLVIADYGLTEEGFMD